MDSPKDPEPVENATPDRLTVHRRTERSLLTRLLHTVLRPFRPRLVRPSKAQPPESPRLSAPRKARKRCNVNERQVEGMWVYDLTSLSVPQDADHQQRILYFAGGGWQSPPTNDHWGLCAEMVCRIPNTRATLLSPPLAPNCPVSKSFPQIEKTFRALLQESAREKESIIVAGDSSGGNICLSIATWTLLTGLDGPVPKALMAICPTTYLHHNLPEIKEVDKYDPILTHAYTNTTASKWSPGPVEDTTPPVSNMDPQVKLDWSYDDPRCSPIRADLTPIVTHGVKIHGVTGSYDVLGPDAVAFREECRKRGVTGEWLEWQGQMHCWPLAFKYGLSESREAVDWIIDVLKRS